MIIFLIISVFLLIGCLIHKQHQSILLLISFIIFFVLSAFRSLNVGTDTVNYERLFNFVKYASKLELSQHRIESGWIILNSFVAGLGGDYRVLMVVASLATLLPIFYVAKRFSSNPMLTITLYYLLYFLFYSWNITRQMLAVSIILLAINLLIRNKRVGFIILVLLATLFHTSALLSLLFLLHGRIPTRRSSLSLYVFISAAIGLLGYNLIIQLVSISSYSNVLDYFYPRSLALSASLLITLNTVFIVILYTIKKEALYKIQFKLYYLFVLFYNIAIRVPLSSRLILYFAIVQIMFYPFYFININELNKRYKAIFAFIIIFYAYSVFLRSVLVGEGEVLPYHNLLF